MTSARVSQLLLLSLYNNVSWTRAVVVSVKAAYPTAAAAIAVRFIKLQGTTMDDIDTFHNECAVVQLRT